MNLANAAKAAQILRQIVPGVRDSEIDIDHAASVSIPVVAGRYLYLEVYPNARPEERIRMSTDRKPLESDTCASPEAAREELAKIANNVRRLLGDQP